MVTNKLSKKKSNEIIGWYAPQTKPKAKTKKIQQQLILDEWANEEDEMQAETKQYTCILDVRDRLDRLEELVIICREALTESKLINIKTHVGNILYFYVEKEIKIAEQELKNV